MCYIVDTCLQTCSLVSQKRDLCKTAGSTMQSHTSSRSLTSAQAQSLCTRSACASHVLTHTWPCCRFVQNYTESNPKTHQGMNLRRMSMQEVYKQFGLGEMTIDFIGHAIALHRDDSYMSQPATDTIMKVKLYYNSLTRFEGTASPYIYPLYGLGELPQVRHPTPLCLAGSMHATLSYRC